MLGRVLALAALAVLAGVIVAGLMLLAGQATP